MLTRVAVLMGGVWGFDGWLTSNGMIGLSHQLSAIGQTDVTVYSWDKWQKAAADLKAKHLTGEKVVVVGYSGGGMCGMYMANRSPNLLIHLLVLYDASPPKQIEAASANTNVSYLLCYHNTNPRMWWPGIGPLGGGAPVIEPTFKGEHLQLEFAQQHLAVQYNSVLHGKTVTAVRALNNGADPLHAVQEAEVYIA